LGLVVGAWLVPSASTAGVEAFLPAGAATAEAEPDRILLAQADAAPVESPVSYSSDQADRGGEKYENDCEECHGDDLKGGLNGGPPLRGLAFEEKFADGLPASLLFSFMSSAMPPNSPGRYSDTTYADLLAYILKRNGFQPGAPLPSDFDALDNLIMEK
jgi:mono/diheme cytochrome c family protein